jgi:hypothetical protein
MEDDLDRRHEVVVETARAAVNTPSISRGYVARCDAVETLLPPIPGRRRAQHYSTPGGMS